MDELAGMTDADL
jgi:26S proteasome regulatory subunit T5